MCVLEEFTWCDQCKEDTLFYEFPDGVKKCTECGFEWTKINSITRGRVGIQETRV